MPSSQIKLNQRIIHLLEQGVLIVILIATFWAVGQEVIKLLGQESVHLADLFLLFIYAEVIGMVGAFFTSHRIPVTIPIIIAMTALCRKIVLIEKDGGSLDLLFESIAILVLAGSAYVMSLKDRLSLEKLKLRETEEFQDEQHS